ncbi:CinA-like protein [uncultured Flavonifractor sp.]|uniref:competence/damage-inducible protein A n=1 Tax=Muriventricola aceti TaxID=2981773 RepID=UPI000821DC15|nr:competence/damage-inducible protein A [Muriventricola aceti]MCU6702623.1 competence/damage-inducible protein A [Muriventricola aceti]SCI37060.1 CinA-like protein [uncultured Flavonifractor sp.]SCJ12078.1 CinA-like protein [uncultured Flavonifractor sp.]
MSHTVEILSVGTELLLGNIANTDAQTLSQGLSELGLNVYYHTVVGDNPQRAREAVAIAKKRADIIITTGGLGPTCDDLTKNVLAEAFGKKLVFDEPSAERIRSYFAKTKRPMTENNLQQAMLPEGCTVLANDWGTAPGCAFQAEGVHVIMLPGPPSECRPMFQYRAKPYLQSLSEGVIASHTLKLFGIGESAMEAQLRDQMNAMSNPTLAPYAKEGECELRVTAKAPTDAEAQALLKPTVEQVKALFGSKVYGVDVSSLEEVVEGLLREKGMTIGVAESCTGGLMAKRLTDVAGASQVFLGGIVSYTNQVKAGMLHVPQHLLDQFGAVSPEVALAMAEGARKALGCDIALATTGVAGPDKDDWDNEVGTMFVAIATPDGTHVRPLKLGSRPVRARLRTQTAHHAFDLARRYLTGLPYEDGAV